MSRRAERCALVAAWLGTALAAQGEVPAPRVVVDVAFAAAPHRGKLPALSWLCETWLPAQPTFPRELDPRRPFRIALDGETLAFAAAAPPPGDDVVAAGSCRVDGGPALLFACTSNGVEDWFVPAGFVLPDAWANDLRTLAADAIGVPRTLATAVVVGHLAGGLAEDDPRAGLLQLGASLCGDVTWLAWRAEPGLRVRGRSDGGLALPAALALLTGTGPDRDGLALRAYAARDPDRAEAARQLARRDDTAALGPLRALLHSDDATRLSTIDTLIRRRSAEDLPAIVAAADANEPWTTLAAADALRTLWPVASAAVRERTRDALAKSQCVHLRAIDVDALRAAPPPGPALLPRGDGTGDGAGAGAGSGNDAPLAIAPWRVHALIWLGLVALGLGGLLLRERSSIARPA